MDSLLHMHSENSYLGGKFTKGRRWLELHPFLIPIPGLCWSISLLLHSFKSPQLSLLLVFMGSLPYGMSWPSFLRYLSSWHPYSSQASFLYLFIHNYSWTRKYQKHLTEWQYFTCFPYWFLQQTAALPVPADQVQRSPKAMTPFLPCWSLHTGGQSAMCSHGF